MAIIFQYIFIVYQYIFVDNHAKSWYIALNKYVVMGRAGDENMSWSKKQSITLSLVCTKVIIVIVFAIVAFIIITLFNPELYTQSFEDSTLFTPNQIKLGLPLLIIASIPAEIALFCLHKLLSHIQVDEVFTETTIHLLRAISWACFAAAIVFFVGFFLCLPIAGIELSLFIVAAFAGFAGLIMRVVKNVIAAACEIKDENDYTI